MRDLSPRLSATVVLGAVVVTGMAAREGPAPEVPPEQAPYVKGADLALLQEVREVARRVERIAGRRLGSVIAVRADEEALRDTCARRVASWGLASRLPGRGRAWADIGLGDESTPSVLLRLVGSDLPGMALDPVGRRLLVSADLMSPKDFEAGAEDTTTVLLATGVRPDETLVAHALVHLLQSGREDRSKTPESTDRLLARFAWDEGEAGLVALLYLFEGLGLGREVLDGRLDPAEVLGGRLLPDLKQVRARAAESLLEFVFREGFFRAAGVARAGGMEALQKAARERPTTRDLLHPDRSPLPAKREETGAAVPPGMRLLDSDELGEQAIVALVSALTGKDNLALVAGDGWAGDALLRFEPADGSAPASGVTLWVTRWGSGNDAEEFEFAWRRCLEARFPAGRAVGAGEPTSLRMEAGARSITWSRSAEEVRVRIAPRTKSSIPQ